MVPGRLHGAGSHDVSLRVRATSTGAERAVDEDFFDIPIVVTLPDVLDTVSNRSITAGLLDAADAPGTIIVDMTGTTVCDSSGVRVLLAVHDRAVASGCRLRVVVSPDSAVARVMTVSGADRLLSVFPTVEDAMPDASVAMTFGTTIANALPQLPELSHTPPPRDVTIVPIAGDATTT
jgi:anti-sigma B factor antagonist